MGKSGLTFVFVHGLSGWGSYDAVYQRMPYWGMRGADVIAYLRQQGFSAYAASVSPLGSAWDRACELYAQLSGGRVDYGLSHSERCHHERFGRDFSSCPLLPSWDEKDRLVLLGHSFGGTTAFLFASLMAKGDEAERERWKKSLGKAKREEIEEEKIAEGREGKVGKKARVEVLEDISPLFLGGMGEKIAGVVTLAAPLNGTTAYDMMEDPAFHPDQVKAPRWSYQAIKFMSIGKGAVMDGRDLSDYAAFDMHVDEAAKLLSRMDTLPSVYYVAVPCSITRLQKDGTHKPVHRKTEPLYLLRSYQMGAYKGKTKGGIWMDEAWRENDGLVNTISQKGPMHAPKRDYDGRLEKGVWNVFPTFDGDHMSLQGGMFHKKEIRSFYLELLKGFQEVAR